MKNIKSQIIDKADRVELYTLTCTWAGSYGAVLQAYALAKKINELGWRAKIINYQPSYYNVSGIKNILNKTYQQMKINIFDRQYLGFLKHSGLITGITYKNIDDLRRAKLSASSYIVGSDQVWNCVKYYNGLDDAMFLDFVPPKSKRIAYAASLSMPDIPISQRNRYRRLLSKFYTISVRENSGINTLTNIGIDNVKNVVDPVFLIDVDNWSLIADNSKLPFSQAKYVVVICLEEKDSIYNYARKKADMLGVKLYAFRGSIIHYKNHKHVDKTYMNITVYEYLNIIRNAEAVVSDSFHALSFSIIFNREIDIILRNDKGNSRILDLLAALDISNRVTTQDRIITANINYDKVNKKIGELKAESTDFLIKSILGSNE